MAADSRICTDTHNGSSEVRFIIQPLCSHYILCSFFVFINTPYTKVQVTVLCQPPTTLCGLVSTLSKWSNILGIASLMLNLVIISWIHELDKSLTRARHYVVAFLNGNSHHKAAQGEINLSYLIWACIELSWKSPRVSSGSQQHYGNTSWLSWAITDVLNRQKVTCSLVGTPNNKKKKKWAGQGLRKLL